MKLILAALAVATTIAAGFAGQAGAQTPAKTDQQRGIEIMQKQMSLMTPELAAQAGALPPEIKQFLAKVAIKHTRHSETLTMAQVMQEILADYQGVAAGLASDNGELAADAARRIANHRLPRGGMLPYLALQKVNGRDLSVLPAMEEAVEGSALRLAAAAERGDMATAAQQFGVMTSGCVACHAHFRGQPGVTPRLRK